MATATQETVIEETASTKADSPLVKHENQPVAPHGKSADILEMIREAAFNPEYDIERMERMFSFYQKVQAQQAEAEFAVAMAAAQHEMQPVVKNRMNNHTGSAFAALDAIHETIKPIYTAYGFSLSFSSKPSELAGHVHITCTVRHRSGHKEVHEDDYPIDAAGTQGKLNKTPIQAKGSTQTYARRYMEIMVFNIPIKSLDDDGAPAAPAETANAKEQPLTKAQIKKLKEEMAAAGVDDTEMCKIANIDKLENLAQGRMSGAIKRLKQIKARKESAQ